jgi:hypothetical protein
MKVGLIQSYSYDCAYQIYYSDNRILIEHLALKRPRIGYSGMELWIIVLAAKCQPSYVARHATSCFWNTRDGYFWNDKHTCKKKY